MRKTVAISLAAIAAGLFAAAGWSLGAFDLGLSSLRTIADRVINPGPLTRRHAEDRRLEECSACHDAVEGVVDGRCLKCHEKVGDRIAEKRGYHGNLTGECRQCHTDHRGASFDIVGLDRTSFNHDQALYRLRGRHTDVSCDRCHGKPTAYIGVSAGACVSCHKDPHAGSLGATCVSCHSEHGWKGKDLLFDHDRQSTYKLTALHREVACAKCHRENRYKPIDPACLACHKDPHAATLGDKCSQCHTERGWKGGALTFDHRTQSRFTIDALHRAVTCAQCHDKGRYRPLESSCASCHGDFQAMLQGSFPAAGGPVGPHAVVSCEKCHQPDAGKKDLASYRGDCVRCHNDRYGKLYLDWIDVLESLALKVGERISRLEDAGENAGAGALRGKLRDARRIGSHNIPLARVLLEKLADPADDIDTSLREQEK